MATEAVQPRRARRGSGAVTLHDVAKLAGVAPITASRAVNTPDQVSEEVRKRVSAAIARTGYVPNRLAGSLASTRSRLVAAVVPTISGPVFLGTVQALTESLAAFRTIAWSRRSRRDLLQRSRTRCPSPRRATGPAIT